jgi:hypothetical protein
MSDFKNRYGPWALVAGASEGLGAAFVRALGSRGLDVVAVARRPDVLAETSARVVAELDISVRPVTLDLAEPDAAARLLDVVADLDVGLLVYNAALSSVGPFLDIELDEHRRAVAINCATPLALTHGLGRRMRARGRGGIIAVSSLAGLQGSPFMATYGAGKAFGRVLAEGLWQELGEHGIDVVASLAGATNTPGYLASRPDELPRLAPAAMEPGAVVEDALFALGRQPRTVPGLGNRWASWLIGLMPRRLAIRTMGAAGRAVLAAQQRRLRETATDSR